eukprot:g4861.t1
MLAPASSEDQAADAGIHSDDLSEELLLAFAPPVSDAVESRNAVHREWERIAQHETKRIFKKSFTGEPDVEENVYCFVRRMRRIASIRKLKPEPHLQLLLSSLSGAAKQVADEVHFRIKADGKKAKWSILAILEELEQRFGQLNLSIWLMAGHGLKPVLEDLVSGEERELYYDSEGRPRTRPAKSLHMEAKSLSPNSAFLAAKIANDYNRTQKPYNPRWYHESDGSTALHRAATAGHLGCVKVLLRAGWYANQVNFCRRTAGNCAMDHIDRIWSCGQIAKILHQRTWLEWGLEDTLPNEKRFAGVEEQRLKLIKWGGKKGREQALREAEERKAMLDNEREVRKSWRVASDHEHLRLSFALSRSGPGAMTISAVRGALERGDVLRYHDDGDDWGLGCWIASTSDANETSKLHPRSPVRYHKDWLTRHGHSLLHCVAKQRYVKNESEMIVLANMLIDAGWDLRAMSMGNRNPVDLAEKFRLFELAKEMSTRLGSAGDGKAKNENVKMPPPKDDGLDGGPVYPERWYANLSDDEVGEIIRVRRATDYENFLLYYLCTGWICDDSFAKLLSAEKGAAKAFGEKMHLERLEKGRERYLEEQRKAGLKVQSSKHESSADADEEIVHVFTPNEQPQEENELKVPPDNNASSNEMDDDDEALFNHSNGGNEDCASAVYAKNSAEARQDNGPSPENGPVPENGPMFHASTR